MPFAPVPLPPVMPPWLVMVPSAMRNDSSYSPPEMRAPPPLFVILAVPRRATPLPSAPDPLMVPWFVTASANPKTPALPPEMCAAVPLLVTVPPRIVCTPVPPASVPPVILPSLVTVMVPPPPTGSFAGDGRVAAVPVLGQRAAGLQKHADPECAGAADDASLVLQLCQRWVSAVVAQRAAGIDHDLAGKRRGQGADLDTTSIGGELAGADGQVGRRNQGAAHLQRGTGVQSDRGCSAERCCRHP